MLCESSIFHIPPDQHVHKSCMMQIPTETCDKKQTLPATVVIPPAAVGTEHTLPKKSLELYMHYISYRVCFAMIKTAATTISSSADPLSCRTYVARAECYIRVCCSSCRVFRHVMHTNSPRCLVCSAISHTACYALFYNRMGG